MSTSSLTRDTRDFPIGSSDRQAIERRVLEAQAELRRKASRRKPKAQSDKPIRRGVNRRSRTE